MNQIENSVNAIIAEEFSIATFINQFLAVAP